MNRMPVDILDEIISEAIYDVHDLTQAPEPLIASSVFSAISLSCQGLIKVRVSETLEYNTSISSLVIANSGERKTSVDRMVLAPFYQHDKVKLAQSDEMKSVHYARLRAWSEREKGILSQIRKKTVKGECTASLSDALVELQLERPFIPKMNKIIYNNVTPEALQYAMYHHGSHIGLIADEGTNILDRKVMSEFSFINSIWDGVPFSVERKTSPSFTIENGRITLSVMVQEKPFNLYLRRMGEKARGSGFFARCLIVHIDEQLSTQGERFIDKRPKNSHYLTLFHKRINELLNEKGLQNELSSEKILSFTPAALYAWQEIYNLIESRIGPDGDYANMNDFASKLANNVARLSALLSYFTQGDRAIEKEYVESAWLICEWYMKQAINLFGHEDGYHEALLLSWLHREYSRRNVRIKYNDIRRYGPNVLRKGKLLDKVVSNLEKENVIEIDHLRYGARVVCRGRDFYDNIFTKNPVFSFY